MSISAQFLPQKISAHYQFHLLNLREILFVTPEMIAKKIKKMKDDKSLGVDGIPPKLLKDIVEQISTPLANVSLVTRRRNSSFRIERSKHYTAI